MNPYHRRPARRRTRVWFYGYSLMCVDGARSRSVISRTAEAVLELAGGQNVQQQRRSPPIGPYELRVTAEPDPGALARLV